MYFDLRKHSSGSDRFGDRLTSSVVPLDEEFRRKEEGANREIPAVPGDHCLSDFGYLNEEGVFRPVFLAHLQLLRCGTLLSGLRYISRRFDPDLAHHACPE